MGIHVVCDLVPNGLSRRVEFKLHAGSNFQYHAVDEEARQVPTSIPHSSNALSRSELAWQYSVVRR